MAKYVSFINWQGEEEVFAVVKAIEHNYSMGYEYALVSGYFQVPEGEGWEYPPAEQTDEGVFLGLTWRRKERFALEEVGFGGE
jgi:hypothetical protein